MGVVAVVVLTVGSLLAIKQVPWFGPWLANGLRAVIGTEAVTCLEELSAKIEDSYNRVVRTRTAPRSLEQAQPALSFDTSHAEPPPPTLARPPKTPVPVAAVVPPFRPNDVSAMHSHVAAKGDGSWRAVTDPYRPEAEPILFATLLHPDPKRPWAEVFVVAMPVAGIRLYAVAGTAEPEATTEVGRDYVRSGLIPIAHQPQLLAAFNGGFMTRHGRHGMRVEGVTLVSPRPHLCTVLGLQDGSLRIGTWKAMQGDVERAERDRSLVFWRQGAPCMYEAGVLNPRLRDEKVRNWGATIDGDVVIRRSAAGLDAARELLFVGLSNDTTARAMAEAMHHAGASDVAQLDVNWSYPRFVVFPAGPHGKRQARGVFEGFVFHPEDYVRRPATRDFFYLLRREEPAGP